MKWHDGKPFTAADVKCTWDAVTGKRNAGWRKSPRRGWYNNLQEVTTKGDHEVTFVLGRPQPSFMSFLASGMSPVFPCHVEARVMRQKPIGTGPFRVEEFRPNASIRLVRNPSYWREGRPYLDAIEYRIIRNRSTRMLAFAAGEFDMTFPYDVSVALLRDVAAQAPTAQCQVTPTNVATQLLINREMAPFDNPQLRLALLLALDRKAMIDILGEGKFTLSGIFLPPPDGAWGLAPADLADLPGYGQDVEANRAEARRIMQSLGYGPDNPLRIKVQTRELQSYRDPAVLVIDHLKSIHIEGTLEILDTSVWYATMGRKGFGLAVNQSGLGLDDPDAVLYEGFACGGERNYENYCNRDLQQQVDRQSATLDLPERQRLVREIDRGLQRDIARPMLFHGAGATCWFPQVRGVTVGVNSISNHWRMDDAWLAPRQ